MQQKSYLGAYMDEYLAHCPGVPKKKILLKIFQKFFTKRDIPKDVFEKIKLKKKENFFTGADGPSLGGGKGSSPPGLGPWPLPLGHPHP